MRIMSINMNDFGGKNKHLMNYRYFSNRDQSRHIDWKQWSRHDKTENWRKLKKYILKKNPDIFFVEEMLISCFEEINFIEELKAIGYCYIYESLPERRNSADRRSECQRSGTWE